MHFGYIELIFGTKENYMHQYWAQLFDNFHLEQPCVDTHMYKHLKRLY